MTGRSTGAAAERRPAPAVGGHRVAKPRPRGAAVLRRGRAALIGVIGASASLGTLGAPGAEAAQQPTATLAGPSTNIVDLGGAAMAPDGTGGVVYRALDGGRAHVYVARYDGRTWRTPQRVDAGQAYSSSFPRIAAASGGRLLVAWVQEGGAGSDLLYVARTGPGSGAFSSPQLADPNVGESIGTFPTVALGPGGLGFVSYNAPGGALPGPVEFRLARVAGGRVSRLPALNRDVTKVVSALSPASAPKVAVDAEDRAIVAWQEPDDSGIPRVYARRATRRGIGGLTQVSPAAVGGVDLPAAADGFALAAGGDGEGTVAIRQLTVGSSPLRSPRIFASRLTSPRRGAPAVSAPFGPAVLADGLGPLETELDGRGPEVPSLGLADDGSESLALTLGASGRIVGDATPIGSLDPATGQPATSAGRGGTRVSAWVSAAAPDRVTIVEDPLRAAPLIGTASAAAPGPVDGLAVAGTGTGSAVVAMQQGRAEATQIAAAVVDAAPAPFAVRSPPWQRPGVAQLDWDGAPGTAGPVSYRVFVDRRAIGPASTRTTAALPRLADGTHTAQVVATDRVGQQTLADTVTVRIDSRDPLVTPRQDGRRVRVRVDDPGGRLASGVDPEATVVRFGDGARATGTSMEHRYTRSGRYPLRVAAVDRAGNTTVLRRTVVIP